MGTFFNSAEQAGFLKAISGVFAYLVVACCQWVIEDAVIMTVRCTEGH